MSLDEWQVNHHNATCGWLARTLQWNLTHWLQQLQSAETLLSQVKAFLIRSSTFTKQIINQAKKKLTQNELPKPLLNIINIQMFIILSPVSCLPRYLNSISQHELHTEWRKRKKSVMNAIWDILLHLKQGITDSCWLLNTHKHPTIAQCSLRL